MLIVERLYTLTAVLLFLTISISLPPFTMADRRSEIEEQVRKRFGDVNIGVGGGGRGRRRPFGMPGTVGNPEVVPPADGPGERRGPGMGLEGTAGGKLNWPEVVGLTGEEAATKIKAEKPNVKTAIVPNGAMVTMDHRMDRVRIYVNTEGKVEVPPRLG